jgi:hypothetical protein
MPELSWRSATRTDGRKIALEQGPLFHKIVDYLWASEKDTDIVVTVEYDVVTLSQQSVEEKYRIYRMES